MLDREHTREFVTCPPPRLKAGELDASMKSIKGVIKQKNETEKSAETVIYIMEPEPNWDLDMA